MCIRDSDNSSAAIAMQRTRRPICMGLDSMRRILSAEPFNLALLPAGVFSAPRGSVSPDQVPANPNFLRQGIAGSLQFPNPACGISFRDQPFAEHHVGRGVPGRELQRFLGERYAIIHVLPLDVFFRQPEPRGYMRRRDLDLAFHFLDPIVWARAQKVGADEKVNSGLAGILGFQFAEEFVRLCIPCLLYTSRCV